MRHLYVLAPLLGMLAALPAMARDADSIWSFNGYGTLGAVYSSEDDADYLPNLYQDSGAGFTNDVSLGTDSRLAAQLGVFPTPRLSAVVQVIAEDRREGAWEPELEWAYLRYAFTPGLTVGAGRTAIDTFLVSRHRKVGYSIPWVRPPVEVYALVPRATTDGADVTYEWNRGDWVYHGQVNVGRSPVEGSGDEVNVDGFWGVYHSLGWGALSTHLAYQEAEVLTPVTDPLFDAIEALGPEGVEVRRRYDPDGRWMSYLVAGASYDPGDWFLMGEWGRGDSHSITGAVDAWYVSGGYRFGGFTPYATYARTDRVGDAAVEGLTVSAYPPALAPLAAGLNASLEEIRGIVALQETVSAGVRWDVAPKVAVKFQYDRVDVTDGSPGSFLNHQPDFDGGTVNLFSIAVDFLF